jgi:cell shape-determining protein MreD
MRRELLLAIPILLLSIMLQTAVISRITLLHGSADLLLVLVSAWGLQERVRSAWIWGAAAGLLVGVISGSGWYVYLAGYLVAVGAAQLLVNRVWQAPLLAMFAVTLVGSLVLLTATYFFLFLTGTSLPFSLSFIQIILPSSLLNLLLAIPVYSLMHDLAIRLYPEIGSL